MVRRLALLLALLFVSLSLLAKDKKKEKDLLPQFILEGRYVYVMNEVGYSTVSQGTVGDYRAESAVREWISKWGRYEVVYSPDQADFIIGVRVARPPVSPGIKVGTGRDGGTIWGPAVGADTGPTDDMLSVYSPNSGTSSAPFWRKTQKYGLSGPLPLLQAFRKDVEKSTGKQ
jgi:hypothetical protein